MTAYEALTPKTGDMESAIYAALDACDAYAQTVAGLLAEQAELAEPNVMLVKRLKQFRSKVDAIVKLIEDDVTEELLFCTDRLFSVELAERGEFI